MSFVGSPESSVVTTGQLISVQYCRNVLPSDPSGPTSASPRPSHLGHKPGDARSYIKHLSVVEEFLRVGWAR